jgi:RNA polymerase sigma-70 factor (ECF subfamily)
MLARLIHDLLGKRKIMKTAERNWKENLVPGSLEREKALGELRLFLLKGVRGGLSLRPGTDRDFIEDVVQTALLRILDNLESFEGRSAFTTWALAIALRVAFSELRRRHWGNVSLEELREKGAVLPDEIDMPPNPMGTVMLNRLLTLMNQLIRTRLTPRQRDVLTAQLNSMPQDEIARQMNMTRNAVYKLAHDARKALKQGLEAAGYGSEQVRDILEGQEGR